jgi:hypothetical protein
VTKPQRFGSLLRQSLVSSSWRKRGEAVLQSHQADRLTEGTDELAGRRLSSWTEQHERHEQGREEQVTL